MFSPQSMAVIIPYRSFVSRRRSRGWNGCWNGAGSLRDPTSALALPASAVISGSSRKTLTIHPRRISTGWRNGSPPSHRRIILVKSISRFARNTKECLEIVREMKSIGVSVYFEEQRIDTANLSGEFMTSLFAAIAQKESESISANLRWGVKARMQNGCYLPPCQPFGYKLADKKIVVNEAQATYVREIFAMYLNGKNMREIAEYLNQEKINHPEIDREWTYCKVSAILQNEKYIGDSLWQKTYMTDTSPRYIK